LVKQLSHPVAWWRNTAQRLIIERQDQTVVSKLCTLLAESPTPFARLHALYTLDGFDATRQKSDRLADGRPRSLNDASLRRALNDPEPNIRRHAVRLAALTSSLQGDLLKMANDSDSGVRFQLALAIGRNNDPRTTHALATLLSREDTPPMRLAILCGIGKNTWPLIRELMLGEAQANLHRSFIEQVSEQFGSQASESSLEECFDWITADKARSRSADGLAMLAGLSRGLFARGNSLRESNLPVKLLSKRVTEGLHELVRTADAIVGNANHSLDDRTRAAVIAANGEPTDVERLVHEMVQPSQPQPLQAAVVRAAAYANSPGAWKTRFSQWASHTTLTREVMIAESLRSSAGTNALVSALEGGILSAGELPASTREVLAQLHDETLRGRVRPLLASIIPADRTEVLTRYAKIATRSGDAARGAGIFKQNCQTCHAMQGVGKKVGPDLASVASRRKDLLIVDILDPSRQVSPDYVNYLAVTKDGRVLNGIISSETSESVTLRREEGQQDTIPRSNIEELRATGKSIMPDGLEAKLTPDQLADLLEFLQHPNVSQLN
jgi:putative heme-binding domain-containing protein